MFLFLPVSVLTPQSRWEPQSLIPPLDGLGSHFCQWFLRSLAQVPFRSATAAAAGRPITLLWRPWELAFLCGRLYLLSCWLDVQIHYCYVFRERWGSGSSLITLWAPTSFLAGYMGTAWECSSFTSASQDCLPPATLPWRQAHWAVAVKKAAFCRDIAAGQPGRGLSTVWGSLPVVCVAGGGGLPLGTAFLMARVSSQQPWPACILLGVRVALPMSPLLSPVLRGAVSPAGGMGSLPSHARWSVGALSSVLV